MTHSLSVVLNSMEGGVKVLLLAAQILLVTAQANYRSLPDLYRQHIDKALKKANANFGVGHHVAFHSLYNKPMTMASNLNVHVLLIVTTCKKAPADAYEHRDECNIRKDKTPIIDCLVCKTNVDELVDCAIRRDVVNKKRNKVRSSCVTHYTGAGSSFQKTEDNQIGCLGCM